MRGTAAPAADGRALAPKPSRGIPGLSDPKKGFRGMSGCLFSASMLDNLVSRISIASCDEVQSNDSKDRGLAVMLNHRPKRSGPRHGCATQSNILEASHYTPLVLPSITAQVLTATAKHVW